jgi:hypothetical protein
VGWGEFASDCCFVMKHQQYLYLSLVGFLYSVSIIFLLTFSWMLVFVALLCFMAYFDYI